MPDSSKLQLGRGALHGGVSKAQGRGRAAPAERFQLQEHRQRRTSASSSSPCNFRMRASMALCNAAHCCPMIAAETCVWPSSLPDHFHLLRWMRERRTVLLSRLITVKPASITSGCEVKSLHGWRTASLACSQALDPRRMRCTVLISVE